MRRCAAVTKHSRNHVIYQDTSLGAELQKVAHPELRHNFKRSFVDTAGGGIYAADTRRTIHLGNCSLDFDVGRIRGER